MGTQDSFKFSKWIFIIGVVSIITGFGIFFHAYDNTKATKEGKTTAVTMATPMPNVAIPPIDRSTALKTETATFALG